MNEEIGRAFLEFSTNKLGAMTGELKACVGRLSDTQVWQRHAEHENAVGNLLLHLCGNMRQWVLHAIGGQPDVRVRDEEFGARGGPGGAELMAIFEGTVSEVKEVIRRLPTERLLERVTPQGRNVSALEAIYQVVGHVQQHTGQVVVLTKQITGADLDLTIPRPR